MIKCLFCSYTMESKFNGWITTWCNNCNVKYVINFKKPQIMHYVICSKKYETYIYLSDNKCNVLDLNKSIGQRGILHFNNIPENITPQNMEAKIKTWLLFS